MTWILLGVLVNMGGTETPLNAEFNSQGACQMAQRAVNEMSSSYSHTVCVPKG